MYILGLLSGLVIGLLSFVALTMLSSLGNRKTQNEMHDALIERWDKANTIQTERNRMIRALWGVAKDCPHDATEELPDGTQECWECGRNIGKAEDKEG